MVEVASGLRPARRVPMTPSDELRQRRTTDWRLVTQDDVDAFAGATGDHQWIHVDPERAARGPFGTTVAHGLYTLSLAPVMLAEIWPLDAFDAVLNYGFDRVRFPAPLPVGSQLRMAASLRDASSVAGGSQVLVDLRFERRGAEKPVCAAVWVLRLYGEEARRLVPEAMAPAYAP
jgi:acyl dehydratase